MPQELIRCSARGCAQGPLIDMLQGAGFGLVTENSGVDFQNEDVLVKELTGCCAVVAGTEPYPRRVLERLPELRVIARIGVGMDGIDLQACDDLGIAVATTPGVNHHAVAEHTIALLMGVSRGFPLQDQRVRSGDWKEVPTPRVMGQTLGLVGLGRTGQAVATRAVALGMNVIAYEPGPDLDFVEKWHIELLEFHDLLSRADYVSLHSPLLPQTRNMMNADAFARMKPGSVFINTARGGLVDEDALIAALKSGHLRGAGLDVFAVEPLPLSSPLLTFPNVLLSGHVAGLDVESRRDAFIMAAQSVISLRSGQWPLPTVQNLKQVADWKWERPQ